MLPADEEALAECHRRIEAEHGADWVARAELLAATWTTDTAATVVRDSLEGLVSATRPGVSSG